MNKLNINPNSLLFRIIINLLYLFLGLSLTFLFYQYIYKNNILSIIGMLTIIPILNLYRKDLNFNLKIINKIIIFNSEMKKNPFFIIRFFNPIINIVFILFFILGFMKIPFLPLIKGEHDIFNAVSIVITVSSIVLTILYTALQQFENKYSDFGYIIQNLKKQNFNLFIWLIIYTTISFIGFNYGSNSLIDFIIMIVSVYLVIKLVLIAFTTSLLMNFQQVLNEYIRYIKSFFKKFNISENNIVTQNTDKMLNEMLGKGIKNFIKFKIFGIYKKKYYFISDEMSKELEEKIDPIFRISEILLKENNLNDFKFCLNAIYEIMQEYNKILYAHDFQGKIYYFVAYKLKDLFNLSVKLNYQTFPEYITDINEKIGLLAIKEQNKNSYFPTSQTIAIDYYTNNAINFVITALSLDNTQAPKMAIASLRQFANKFIYNNSLDKSSIIIDKLTSLATTICALNNSKKTYNSSWCVYLINIIEIDAINIIYYLLAYQLSVFYSYSINHSLEKTIKAFKDSFTIHTTYKTYPSDFSNLFINCGTDINLHSLTQILINKPFLKTPYLNSVLNNNPISVIYLNSIDSIFNAIFVCDFIDDYKFELCIYNLSKLFEIYIYATDIFVKTDNLVCIESLLQSLLNVLKYSELFINRIKETKFHKKTLLGAMENFLSSFYETLLKIIEKILSNDNSIDLKDLVHLIYKSILLNNENTEFNNIISAFIKKLLINIEKITNEHTKKNFIKSINLITLLCSEIDKKSEFINILYDFVIKNVPKEKGNYQFDFDGYDTNFLPRFSNYFNIDINRIEKYSAFLLKKQNNKRKKRKNKKGQ